MIFKFNSSLHRILTHIKKTIMTKNSNHPTNVTILAVFVLFITSWNAIRVYSVIANWWILIEFGASPVYIVIIGLFWVLTGFWLFNVLWKGHRHGIRYGLGTAGLYVTWYWFDRIVMQPSPAPNALFSLITSIVLLAIFSVTLVLPNSKAFFDKE